MKGPGFNPQEIIFAVTDECNLHCAHCFVSRNRHSLKSSQAIAFLESCRDKSSITQIGFSGGEPFLALNFICDVVKYGVENDFTFDRITTNGVWWNNEEQLMSALNMLYDSGYDGKIGISFDAFHGQSVEQVETFCRAVYKVWQNPRCLEMQSVVCVPENGCGADDTFLEKIDALAEKLECDEDILIDDKTGCGTVVLEGDEMFLPVYRTPVTYSSGSPKAFKDRKWFMEDFCAGPGQILFVHPTGDIAPCCGFANENKALFTGSIDQTYEEVEKQWSENKMVQLCYCSGLSSVVKQFKNRLPGVTGDPCTFCDWLCKNQ